MHRNDEIAQLYADIREQVRYLQELGVDSLNIDLQKLDLLPAALDKELADVRPAPPPAVIARPAPAQLKVKTRPFTSRLGSLPTLSDRPVAPSKRETPGDT